MDGGIKASRILLVVIIIGGVLFAIMKISEMARETTNQEVARSLAAQSQANAEVEAARQQTERTKITQDGKDYQATLRAESNQQFLNYAMMITVLLTGGALLMFVFGGVFFALNWVSDRRLARRIKAIEFEHKLQLEQQATLQLGMPQVYSLGRYVIDEYEYSRKANR